MFQMQSYIHEKNYLVLIPLEKVVCSLSLSLSHSLFLSLKNRNISQGFLAVKQHVVYVES